jgi:hypothetical protein
MNDRLPLAADSHEQTPKETTAPTEGRGTVEHMMTNLEPGTITLTLTEHLADMLAGNRSPNFYEEQAERFELLGGFDLPLPNDGVFVGGTMNFCGATSDALLLRAYEQGCGHTVTMLWDLATEEYVVLSSRRFPWGGRA